MFSPQFFTFVYPTLLFRPRIFLGSKSIALVPGVLVADDDEDEDEF